MADDPTDIALGLPAIPRERPEPAIPDENQEYEFARKNIARMIGRQEQALSELQDIADISAHPRAYEVLFTGMKEYVNSNRELLNLKKTQRELSGDSGPTHVTTNQTMVMSTDQMLRLIKSKMKDDGPVS